MKKANKAKIIAFWEVQRITISLNVIIYWYAAFAGEHLFNDIGPGNEVEPMSMLFFAGLQVIVANILIFGIWILHLLIPEWNQSVWNKYTKWVMLAVYLTPWLIILPFIWFLFWI